jgi:hypothetical protein
MGLTWRLLFSLGSAAALSEMLAPSPAQARKPLHVEARKLAPEVDKTPSWLVTRIASDGSISPIGDSNALVEKPDVKRHPASITKLALALVVIEKMHVDADLMATGTERAAKLPAAERRDFLKHFIKDNGIGFPQGPKTIVTFSRNAFSTTGSTSGLPAGTKIGAGMLLALTLAHSANDGAMALAEQGWGSEQAAVAAMNARAKVAGMKDTSFATCNGQDWWAPEKLRNNVTTVGDVARLLSQFIPYLDSPGDMAMLAPKTVEVPGRVPRVYQSLESAVLGRNMSRVAGGTLRVDMAKGGINLHGRFNNALLLSDKDDNRYAVVVLHEPSQAAVEARQQSVIAALDGVVNGVPPPRKMRVSLRR